jgi:FixJ family two-component response regulator
MSKNKKHIAVVDDDDSYARALGRLLRASQFEVRTYPSAEAFLVPTTQPPPDCLVLDIQLGGMSGLELLRWLRELGALTPVIFVTAHDEPEIREEARQSGCIAYLRKPVASHAFLEAVARALESSGPFPSA